jgi:decaprenyl-phosphate phosphoribosyltransferase
MGENSIKSFFALLRPKHWIKNLFVLAPLVFSGLFTSSAEVFSAFFATIIFCVAASVVYVFNDLNDLDDDRKHPVKSWARPLASGQISTFHAKWILGLLVLLLFVGCYFQPSTAMVMVGYVALNFAYSTVLKKFAVVDIFIIAIGFVLRVIAGSFAISVTLSNWMFITTLSLALFLAAIKRRQELKTVGNETREVLQRYTISILDKFAEISATSALLFYSLFIMTMRQEMVVTIPFVLFGFFRYWYIVEFNDDGESPTDALFTDWQLQIAIGLWGASWLVLLLPENV